jgi:TetR/AcrR family transcriptional regulator, cholesterol catabolism regulator
VSSWMSASSAFCSCWTDESRSSLARAAATGEINLREHMIFSNVSAIISQPSRRSVIRTGALALIGRYGEEAGESQVMARKPGVTVAGVRRRAQILQKAEELIAHGGFQDMTMDSIAEALDVSKSGLYHYFRHKDDLLYAIRRENLTFLIADQRERLNSGRPYVEVVKEILYGGIKIVSNSPAKFRAIYELKMKTTTEREAEISALEREYFHLLVATVQGAIDEGNLRPVDPRLVTQAILSLTNHLQYWYKAPGRLSPRAVADAYWDMLFTGISADGERDSTSGPTIPRSARVEFSYHDKAPADGDRR